MDMSLRDLLTIIIPALGLVVVVTGRDPRWTLGRETIAAAPLSGLDWRRSVPPCNSTNELAMARPRPDPFMPLIMTAPAWRSGAGDISTIEADIKRPRGRVDARDEPRLDRPASARSGVAYAAAGRIGAPDAGSPPAPRRAMF